MPDDFNGSHLLVRSMPTGLSSPTPLSPYTRGIRSLSPRNFETYTENLSAIPNESVFSVTTLGNERAKAMSGQSKRD